MITSFYPSIAASEKASIADEGFGRRITNRPVGAVT